MNEFNPDDPHHGQPVLTGGKKADEASAAIIMIHGRGASAESIIELSSELNSKDNFLIAAPQAYGNTWYPYSFLAPREKNEPGITSGLNVIKDIIVTLNYNGIPQEKIILLGFSQGACLTLEYAAQNAGTFGGVIGLSGGLIGDKIDVNFYKGSFNKTPVFLGCSDIDPHIPLERVNESEKILSQLGADVTKRIYPGMGHTINTDELEYINLLLEKIR